MNRIQAFVCCLALTAAMPAVAYEVEEVGSFHIGGKQVTLSGLPARDVQFVPGGLTTRVDPNGEFEAGQMYVQFVKLAKPAARYILENQMIQLKLSEMQMLTEALRSFVMRIAA